VASVPSVPSVETLRGGSVPSVASVKVVVVMGWMRSGLAFVAFGEWW